jgi:hypothetical protein
MDLAPVLDVFHNPYIYWGIILLAGAKYVYDFLQDRKRGPYIQRKTPATSEFLNAHLDWRVPPELWETPPRRVQVKTSTLIGVAFAFVLLLPFVYLALGMMLIANTNLREPARDAIAVSVSAVVGALVLRGILLPRRLLQWGQPTAGVLTEVWSRPGGYFLKTVSGVVLQRTSVRYKFADRDGNLVKGRGRYGSNATPGQVVTVVYDPSRPKRNVLYPLEEFRVGLF